MQSTILFLQQELKTTRDRIQTLEKENSQLKQVSSKDETVTMAAINGSGNKTTIPTTTLETIDENACLASNPSNPDIYNGSSSTNNNEQSVSGEHTPPADEGSNGNGNAARLARKRNYEEEPAPAPLLPPAVPPYSVEEQPAPIREVSAPRTLPPKKSKLRGLATRRNSQLEEEHQAVTAAVTSAVAVPLILDNAVTTAMASEEAAPAGTASGETGTVVGVPGVPADASDAAAPATPARILTRRRSVRMQQNGSGAVDYST